MELVARVLMMNGPEILTISCRVRAIDTIKRLSGLLTTMVELSGMILEKCYLTLMYSTILNMT